MASLQLLSPPTAEMSHDVSPKKTAEPLTEVVETKEHVSKTKEPVIQDSNIDKKVGGSDMKDADVNQIVEDSLIKDADVNKKAEEPFSHPAEGLPPNKLSKGFKVPTKQSDASATPK